MGAQVSLLQIVEGKNPGEGRSWRWEGLVDREAGSAAFQGSQTGVWSLEVVPCTSIRKINEHCCVLNLDKYIPCSGEIKGGCELF